MLLKQNKFFKHTYSQCGEDRVVLHVFKSLGIHKFTYLDVGAHHPFYLSNTALFYEMGMNGINIEPDPFLFREFVKHRKRDINLNIGISEQSGMADFFVISASTLNTFSKDEAEKYALQGDYRIVDTLKVRTENISKVIKEYCNGVTPEFVTIDAEGVDELILNSIDLSANGPIVICVETISFSTSGNGVKNLELIRKIENSGYINYADTNINTIFVKKEAWLR
jgi:FkbM family methyltransferase